VSRRSRSSGRWLREHFADPFVQRAQQEGWRSRAAYKLEEIDRAERLISPGAVIVDLGASPGGWSQYAARPAGRGIASTCCRWMLPGVTFLQATSASGRVDAAGRLQGAWTLCCRTWPPT
jgi:23S rRNA (uridine2552-2'-O)-methyltransferase